jgi:hypothetical protein
MAGREQTSELYLCECLGERNQWLGGAKEDMKQMTRDLAATPNVSTAIDAWGKAQAEAKGRRSGGDPTKQTNSWPSTQSSAEYLRRKGSQGDRTEGLTI